MINAPVLTHFWLFFLVSFSVLNTGSSKLSKLSEMMNEVCGFAALCVFVYLSLVSFRLYLFFFTFCAIFVGFWHAVQSDTEEQGIDEAAVSNSATLRTVLALRNIIFSNNAGSDMTPGFRVVVQLSSECSYIRGCTFLAPDGHDCLFPQDLTKYVNSELGG